VRRVQPSRVRSIAAGLLSLLATAGCRGHLAGAGDRAGGPTTPTLLAHATWPAGMKLGDLEIGGLSDVAHAGDGVFWAVLDDVRGHAPARLLKLRWLPPRPPQPVAWLPLLAADGSPLPAEGADLEGVALEANGGFVVSSEGDFGAALPPWVARFDAGGRLVERLALPPALTQAEGHGPTLNAAFEALGVLPDGAIVAGMEGTLAQDLDSGADPHDAPARPVRLLRWDAHAPASALPREWAYPLEPAHARSPLPDGFRVAGLVDLLSRGADGLLLLERSFVAGRGFRVRLHESALADGAEVTGRDSLAGGEGGRLAKRQVLDLAALGVPLDNYEGVEWGVPIDGHEVLIIVSDNNFSGDQDTHWVAVRWPR
jgi:hypothetical protein